MPSLRITSYILLVLSVILLIIISFFSNEQIPAKTLLNTALNLFSFIAILYSVHLATQFEWFKSVIGKGFTFFILSHIFHILGNAIHFFVYDSAMPFPIIPTLFFFGMYLSWGVAGYYFLYFIGPTASLLKYWKTVILITIIATCTVIVVNNLIPNQLIPLSLLTMLYLLADILLIIQTIMLTIYINGVYKGIFFKTMLFFALGMFFHFLGDILINFGIKNAFIGGMDNIFYVICWFCLTIAPTYLDKKV